MPGELERLIAQMESEAEAITADIETAETDREARCLERSRQLAQSCGIILRMQLATRARLDTLAGRLAALEGKDG